MLLRALALLFVLCLPCRGARAVEVVLGADGGTSYNSNVFYQSTDPTGDGSIRLGPTIALRDRTGQLTWRLLYRPSYEVYYTTPDINSLYQLADGEILWKPSDATELYANETFSLTPAFSSTTETDQASLLAQATPVFSNSSVMQNVIEAGVRHAFAPRWMGAASISSSIVDYQSELNADSGATAAQIYATYAMFPTDRVGTGLGATRQTIDQVGGGSSGSNYYQLFGIWDHEFSPTWSLRVNAGPALVQPDAADFETTRQNAPLYARNVLTRDGLVLSPLSGSSCTPFQGVVVAEGCRTVTTAAGPLDATQTFALDANLQPVDLAQTGTLTQIGTAPKSAGSSITYFANLSVTKRWRWVELTGSYVRNATNTSGFSQSLVTDTLTLTNVWDPSPLWRLTLGGVFTRRQSSSKQLFLLTPVSPVAIPIAFNPDIIGPFSFTGAQAQGLQSFTAKSGLKVMNYGLSAQVNRRITRSTYVYGRALFEKQTTKRTGIASVDTNRFIVTVGFRYEFDPIHILN